MPQQINRTTEGVTVAGKFFPSGTSFDEINRWEVSQSQSRTTVRLNQPAVIGGVLYPAGRTITARMETIEEGYKEAAKNAIRAKIAETAGTDSEVLGTTNDATSLLILFVSKLRTLLQTSSSLEELKQKLTDSGMATVAANFIQKVESGTVKLPGLIKGQAGVIQEIEERFTAIANVFQKGA